jgi:hypothetical protein
MGKDRISAAIERLDDDFKYFSGGPPGEAAVAALEQQLGCRLPPGHRELVAACGSTAVLVNEEVWPPPVAYEIRPQWQMIRGLEIFGVAPPGHPLSMAAKRTELVELRDGDDDLWPLGKVIGISRWLCVDADGDLQWWDDGGGEFCDGDFTDEVLGFLKTLAQDKARVKKEGIQRS